MGNLKIEQGEHGSGKFIISARLDGILLDFLVDTGATFSGVKDIKYLKNQTVIGSHSFLSASGEKFQADEVIAQDLKVGKYTSRNFKMSILPTQFRHEAVLGIDFFRGLILGFKPSTSEISINDKISSSNSQFLLTPKSHISLTCFGSEDIRGIWDTGAELSVVSKEFRSKNAQLFTNPRSIRNGRDSTNTKVDFSLWRMSKLNIGNKEFNELDVLEMDFTPLRKHFPKSTEFILGYNLISCADWEFDLSNELFSVV